MGEVAFTDEELVILGEKEPAAEVQAPLADAEKPAEGEVTPPAEDGTPAPEKQPEQALNDEEKAAAEKKGFTVEGNFIIDTDGSKIPLKRFREVYRESKEADRGRAEIERQFNLFRELGPDKFYELYPDRKPADYKPAAHREETESTIPANIGAMVVQGGPYNGQTLNEVYSVDPAYATSMQNKYLEGVNEQTRTVTQQREALKQEAMSEVEAFSDQLSMDMFGKKAAELSKDEDGQVTETIQSTLDFMAKTRRGGGVIADAYFIMNREGIIKGANEKGAKAALASLTKPAIPSVDTTGKATVPGSDYEGMTSDQLAAKVEAMDEKTYAKFIKEAPDSLKKKHPGLPWD